MAVVLSAAVFALIHGLLGDPTILMLGREADPEMAQRLRHQLGFDRPLYAQYADWISHALRGDLGRSLRDHEPVTRALANRWSVTVELTVLTMTVSVLTALALGTIAAVRAGTTLDLVISTFCVAGVTLPNFVLGIMLIFFFALALRWLPSSGYSSLFTHPLENLQLMILPTVTLSVAYIGFLTLILKSRLRDTLRAFYVQTARAKGVAARRVLLRHAVRNALPPFLSVVGIEVGRLFGGAVITESIFALPGIGRLLVESDSWTVEHEGRGLTSTLNPWRLLCASSPASGP